VVHDAMKTGIEPADQRFQDLRELWTGSNEYAHTHHEEFVGQSAAAVRAQIDRLATRKAAE
jgi:hypothetical protein